MLQTMPQSPLLPGQPEVMAQQNPHQQTLPPEELISFSQPSAVPTQQDPQYQYSPLEGRSFRIVKLLPGERHDKPQCDILHASMDDNPEYEAVSYVWGHGGRRHLVLCASSNAILKVTANCIRCLKELRYPDKARYLWIDAICIDQDSPNERNHQVKLMGSIYEYASRVLIYPTSYLGCSVRSTAALFRLLNQARSKRNEKQLAIPPLFQPCYENLAYKADDVESKINRLRREKEENRKRDPFGFFGTFSERNEKRMREDAKNDHEENLKGLLRQFTRASEWFDRTWVIQEAVLAKAAVMMVGNAELPFDEVLDLLENAAARGEGSQLKLHQSLRLPGDKSMLRLVYDARITKASKPEDKIFVFIGIASDGKDFHDAIDYSKPVEVVYTEFSHRFIDKSQNLDLLSVASLCTRLSRLPRWAVQWDKLADGSYSVLDPMGSRKPHSACGGFTATKKQDLPYTSARFVRGIVFDSVKKQSFCKDPSFSWAKAKTQSLSESSSLHPTGASPVYSNIEAALLNTLTCGTMKTEIADAKRGSGSLTEWALKHGGDPRSPYTSTRFPGSLLYTWDHNSQFRVLTQTHRGFIGLTPAHKGHLGSTAEGDLICIFSGGAVPYVVRKVPGEEGKYWFLGEAYVEGIMNGEAMEGRKENDLQDFCLV
ncbi:heterokaryon incompatibility protein-domain-containing protein [Phyllosticta citricarpa]|uniref:Heterokaryon incompatibility protein-domain-containing protein n=1 Tax=Phyllosticta citricarpa TaxID=55181 RepID=A0ABR1L918_9PEZI